MIIEALLADYVLAGSLNLRAAARGATGVIVI